MEQDKVRPKILFVDDIPMNIKVLVEALKEDYKVIFAQSGPEALDFVDLITRIKLENNTEQARLKEQARMLEKSLRDLNRSIAQDWRIRLKSERYTPQNLRAWLQSYTDYMPQQWGQPHYGYENLDFLLDEILLPFPRPKASLQRKLGMVRYESTPASVILLRARPETEQS